MTTPEQSIRSAEQRRRARILSVLLYVCGALSLIVTVLVFVNSGFQPSSVSIELIGLLLSVAVAIGLLRTGFLAAAAHLLFAWLIVATVSAAMGSGSTSAFYTMFIPIVGATLLLSPRWSPIYAGIALAAYLLVDLFGQRAAPPTIGETLQNTVLFGAYFGIVALLSYLAAQGYERLLAATLHHSAELARARDMLEEQVAEQTTDLRRMLDDLQRSSEMIHELSVPVMPVAENVVVLPVIGALDSQRANLLTERLLQHVQRERVGTVLIDITGVPVMDTQVVNALLRAAEAVRLLGAEPVLVGMRAEVAQTVVALGVDLSRFRVERDLRSGLNYALLAR
jgi:rsbT co-antagonist protein RsbR